MRSSILCALLIISSILLIFSLISFSLSEIKEVWSILFSFWLLTRFWNYCTIRFMSSFNWIWLATIVFSNSWVLVGSSVFWCPSPFATVIESSYFLWSGLSCKLNTRLRCCNCGVPSTLKGFSTMIGLELELLAWLSFLDSLWSLPSDLDQILCLNTCHISPKKQNHVHTTHNIQTIMIGPSIELGLTMAQTMVKHTPYAMQF